MILAGVTLGSQAGPVVKAMMDTSTLMMGKTGMLQLMVEEPKNARGHFPLFNQLRERGYVTVLGDTVEFRAPSGVDTVDLGSQRRILFTVPVQAFDSGSYRLPPFEYVTGADTARSNTIELKVAPVSVSADDQISDYAGTADPEDPSVFDWIPDWVVDYWWIVLIGLVIIGAGVYAWHRYRTKGYLIPKKPEPTPYEEAMGRLNKLKDQKLWEQGMEKEYFTELTDILRRYLARRFGINAEEMTSRQIMASLAKNEETKDKRAYFRKILDVADFVKFAKVRPLPEDNIASYESAVRFVNETKPVPKPEEEDAPEPRGRKNGKKNGKLKKNNKKGGIA